MNLELERKKLELRKVETAKMEMEFKILERLSDIERIRENINNQEATMTMLSEAIKVMEK